MSGFTKKYKEAFLWEIFSATKPACDTFYKISGFQYKRTQQKWN